MKKNKLNDSVIKEEFVEEVSEHVLYDKKNQEDIIYKKSVVLGVKAKIIFIVLILLFLAVLSSLIFSLVFSNNTFFGNSKLIVHDLYVTHSNKNYGGEIKSFEDYLTIDDAFVYNFDVKNSASVDLNYKVQLENLKFNNDIDFSSINYILLDGQEQVVSGKISNNKVVDIADITIDANDVDNLVIKLWSSDRSNKINYKFKVNIIG